MPIAVAAAAIVGLVLLVAWGRVHPFLAFVIVAAAAAFGLGMPAGDVAAAIRAGIGGTLGSLAIVLVTGAMLGKLVVESGAAQRIASVMVRGFGSARIAWAMALTGFVVGIPLFYGVGFVLLVPIIFATAARYALPPVAVGVPALAALSVAHGLLPPHPGPTALVASFHADLGRTLLLGLLIAVPALVLAGPVFARWIGRIAGRPLEGLAAVPLPESQLPGATVSVATALLPAALLLVATAVGIVMPESSPWRPAVAFASDPDVVMLVSLGVATVTLGLARGKSLGAVMQTFAAAIGDVASILLVIGGSGAFKEVLVRSGVDARIAAGLEPLALDPLLLAWLVTVAIRICVGSATVAGLTAAGLLAPLVAARGVDPDLLVLAIGSGSLACSHVNDAGFWLFKEYFGLGLRDTLRTWTAMETIVAVVGLGGVLGLARVL